MLASSSQVWFSYLLHITDKFEPVQPYFTGKLPGLSLKDRLHLLKLECLKSRNLTCCKVLRGLV